jgi:hypothetical protein
MISYCLNYLPLVVMICTLFKLSLFNGYDFYIVKLSPFNGYDFFNYLPLISILLFQSYKFKLLVSL